MHMNRDCFATLAMTGFGHTGCGFVIARSEIPRNAGCQSHDLEIPVGPGRSSVGAGLKPAPTGRNPPSQGRTRKGESRANPNRPAGTPAATKAGKGLGSRHIRPFRPGFHDLSHLLGKKRRPRAAPTPCFETPRAITKVLAGRGAGESAFCIKTGSTSFLLSSRSAAYLLSAPINIPRT